MSTNYIDQITDTAGTTHDISEGDSTRIFRAKCSTAAGTAAKVATLDTSNRNFSLTAGVRVAVTFTYGNSAATPTLRVDGSSTGTAKTIAVATSATTKATGNGTTYNTWGPYETVIFTYDGTYWVNGGSSRSIYNAYQNSGSEIPDNTGSATTGISATTDATKTTLGTANSVTGVQSSTTTASKVTVGSHSTDYGVTAAGSGSASLTLTMDTTDTKKLNISFSHTHTAPSLGSKVPTVSATDVTVPIKNTSSTSIPNVSVAAATVTINDTGHSHTL